MNSSIFEPKLSFSLHPTHLSSMRKVILTLVLLALVMVTVWRVPFMPEIPSISGYLPLHTVLEIISVVISMLVFAVGWNAYSGKLPGNIVMLASVLLGVGVLDLSHTLSYAGMPSFVTSSGADKAIYFWLAARLLATAALFVFAILPWRPFPSAITRYLLLALVLALVAATHWLFLFHFDLLPDVFHPDHGLSMFKINAEYVLIALNLVTALALWLRMRKPQPLYVAALFGAVCTMAMSEFFFTIYADVTDI
ncbi:MAG: hypothetical protein MUP09_07665, partial [Thiovulaceae bacterium]|nr:hypothetical protein [Sulfurimonadaceae bacterium]